jgi:hypothetical protein
MRGDLTASQKEKLAKEASVHESMLRIHNALSFGVTIEDLAAKCREIYKEFEFDMLVIDYSQLLDTKQKVEGARQAEAYVHRALAAMAVEFDCVVASPFQTTRGSLTAAELDPSGIATPSSATPTNREGAFSREAASASALSRVAVRLEIRRMAGAAKNEIAISLCGESLHEPKGTYQGIKTDFAMCNLIAGASRE